MRNLNVRDLDTIPVVDWARLAAFIDGEGHIGVQINRQKTTAGNVSESHWINVVVTNTDVRLVTYLERVFGGHMWRHPDTKPEKWKRAFKWRVACAYAEKILVRVKPYLILKTEQADVALALRATSKRVGVKGHSPETVELRRALKQRMHELNAKGPSATTVN